MPYMKILAAGGAAVAVVAVVAVAGTVIGNHRDTFSRGMKVETAAASLETTEAASESTGERNIVLETTLSAEEIASKEYEKTVQSIVDSYANLGIAEVSGYLNVRKTPESFGEVIGKLPKGGACEILDTSTDGWYKISSGGVTGYVSSQYVYTGDEAKKLAAENVAERAVIDADKLNVRSEPKADANVVEQVFKNERYDIKGQQDGWIQISSGYISADYVTVKYALDEAIKQDMRQTVLSLYDNLGVSNVSNYLNVRDNPDEKKGKIIAKLPSNAGCDILDTSTSGWYKIRSGNITGYVKSEYILTGQQAKDKALQVAKLMAISNTDGVNVRTEPNTNSSIYTQISNSERFLVADQQDGWVKIEIDDQDAYLSSDYVDVKYGLEEAIKYTPVVEVADTSSKNDSKNSSKNSSKNNSGKKNSANDGGCRIEVRKCFLQTCPDRKLCSTVRRKQICLWWNEPDKRNGLLRIYDVCHGEIRCIPAAITPVRSLDAESRSPRARCVRVTLYSTPAAAESTTWHFTSVMVRCAMRPTRGPVSRSLPGTIVLRRRS